MRILKIQLFLIINVLLISALLLVGCGKGAKQAAANPSAESVTQVESKTSADNSEKTELPKEVETAEADYTQATFDDTTSDTVSAEVKPSSGTADKGTASSTAPSTGTNNPTGGQPTATTPPITEPSIPTDSIPPVTQPSLPTESNDCAHKNSNKANCINEGYCWDCNSVIEEINPNVHPKGQELGLFDEVEATCAKEGFTGNWRCYSCYAIVKKGTVIPKLATHVGGTASCTLRAVCSECGKSYGSYDASNHVRADFTVNWERRNVVPSTCTDGYSGDLYCLDCGLLIEKGKTVPPMGCVEEDAVPATCCSYSYCSRCGNIWDWMGYDKNNHRGGTEVRGAFPSSYPCCTGYSGDTYCLGCSTRISKGQSTPATQDHSYQEISRVESETELSITSQCTVCGTISKVSISIG